MLLPLKLVSVWLLTSNLKSARILFRSLTIFECWRVVVCLFFFFFAFMSSYRTDSPKKLKKFVNFCCCLIGPALVESIYLSGRAGRRAHNEEPRRADDVAIRSTTFPTIHSILFSYRLFRVWCSLLAFFDIINSDSVNTINRPFHCNPSCIHFTRSINNPFSQIADFRHVSCCKLNELHPFSLSRLLDPFLDNVDLDQHANVRQSWPNKMCCWPM